MGRAGLKFEWPDRFCITRPISQGLPDCGVVGRTAEAFLRQLVPATKLIHPGQHIREYPEEGLRYRRSVGTMADHKKRTPSGPGSGPSILVVSCVVYAVGVGGQ